MAGGTFHKIDVDFHPGRDAKMTHEENGFALLPHTSALDPTDFWAEQKVVDEWYPECSQIVRAALEKAGCKVAKVVSFDHNVRSVDRVGEALTSLAGSSDANYTARTVNPVAKVAHNDYTDVSARKRVQELGQSRANGGSHTVEGQLLHDSEVDAALDTVGCRFAFINVWRNIDSK
jgi:hypothetical protein